MSFAVYLYNNSVHVLTEINFFKVLFGEKLSWSNTIQKKQDLEVFVARERAVNLLVMQCNLEKKLAKAVALQVKYYNLKHLPNTFAVRDFVYLNNKNINPTRSSKKLD